MHDAIHPEDRTEFERAGEASMLGLTQVHWEGRIVRPDGDVRHVVITSQPRRVGGGTEWHGVVVDRTDVCDELAEHNADLSRRDAARGDLLAMLGHDLAQPLCAIAGFAEQGLDVLDDAQTLDGADAILLRRTLRAVLRNAQHPPDASKGPSGRATTPPAPGSISTSCASSPTSTAGRSPIGPAAAAVPASPSACPQVAELPGGEHAAGPWLVPREVEAFGPAARGQQVAEESSRRLLGDRE